MNAISQRDFSRAPTNAEIRRDQALREAATRYWAKRAHILNEFQWEKDEIERRFWAGEYSRQEAA